MKGYRLIVVRDAAEAGAVPIHEQDIDLSDERDAHAVAQVAVQMAAADLVAARVMRLNDDGREVSRVCEYQS